jgi:hypothetical protein
MIDMSSLLFACAGFAAAFYWRPLYDRWRGDRPVGKRVRPEGRVEDPRQ